MHQSEFQSPKFNTEFQICAFYRNVKKQSSASTHLNFYQTAWSTMRVGIFDPDICKSVSARQKPELGRIYVAGQNIGGWAEYRWLGRI